MYAYTARAETGLVGLAERDCRIALLLLQFGILQSTGKCGDSRRRVSPSGIISWRVSQKFVFYTKYIVVRWKDFVSNCAVFRARVYKFG